MENGLKNRQVFAGDVEYVINWRPLETRSCLMATAALVALTFFAAPVGAQETAEPVTEVQGEVQSFDPPSTGSSEIIVTARKREESLKDVPVAATAITGELIEKRGFTSVKEVAALTPSLNVNSDGAGRAFVSIRGVGTTLKRVVLSSTPPTCK